MYLLLQWIKRKIWSLKRTEYFNSSISAVLKYQETSGRTDKKREMFSFVEWHANIQLGCNACNLTELLYEIFCLAFIKNC